jgi:hypothetical protein
MQKTSPIVEITILIAQKLVSKMVVPWERTKKGYKKSPLAYTSGLQYYYLKITQLLG